MKAQKNSKVIKNVTVIGTALAVATLAAIKLRSYPASATLAWSPENEPIDGYNAYNGNTNGIYTNMVDVGNVTSFLYTNLVKGSTNVFAVTAYANTPTTMAYYGLSSPAESPLSSEVSYIVPWDNLIPLVLQSTGTNVAGTTNTISLSWNGQTVDTGTIGYMLDFGINSHNYTNCSDMGNAIGTTVSNLVPGYTYFFTIISYRADMTGTNSQEFWYTVPSAPKTNVPLTPSIANGVIYLTAPFLPNHTYTFQKCCDLVNWQTILTTTTPLYIPANALFKYHSTIGDEQKCYFRLLRD